MQIINGLIIPFCLSFFALLGMHGVLQYILANDNPLKKKIFLRTIHYGFGSVIVTIIIFLGINTTHSIISSKISKIKQKTEQQKIELEKQKIINPEKIIKTKSFLNIIKESGSVREIIEKSVNK
jgi:hypothetical protein